MYKKFEPIFENVESHLAKKNFKSYPIMLNGTPLTKGQFGFMVNPVICESGLVYLNPRWTKESYDDFYKYFYDDLYRLETKVDYGIDGVINNMKEVFWRSKIILDKRGSKNILDVGCGSGHGLKLLKDNLVGININGIEASPYCCKILKEEVGANLIDTDLDGNWTDKYAGEFDFIIMRHVVEHILEPVESLKRIKNSLSDNGFIYISVPDMYNPRTRLRDYDKWWEYWFRAVHPYYYNIDTLFETLKLAGLYPFEYGCENEEIWCLVDKNYRDIQGLKEDTYYMQKKVLEELLP